MVRVRKLAQHSVRAESLLSQVTSPLREALGQASQLDSELSQSSLGSLAARRLMPGVFLLLLLPALFVIIPLLGLAIVTHLTSVKRYGSTTTYVLEGLLIIALIARAVMRARAARRAEPDPINEEFTLAPVEVEERLASGQLRPWDLVHDGQVWNTLEQSPAFEFACEEPLARLRTRRRLVGTAKLLAWVAALVGYAHWLTSE